MARINEKLVGELKKDYLTAEELAEVFRLKSYKTILNWNCDGKFKKGVEVVKFGGILLFYWPAIKEKLHAPPEPPKKRTKNIPKPQGCLINL